MEGENVPQLPAEVILQISRQCDRNARSALSQTTKGFYTLLRDEVWKTLVFTAKDFESHLQRHRTRELSRQQTGQHDILTYLLGGCHQKVCEFCPGVGYFTTPSQPWQTEVVQELVFDFWQWEMERGDRQWAHESCWDEICMEVISAFPLVKRIGWRSHIVPTTVAGNTSTVDQFRLTCLEFCLDPCHPDLPSVWDMGTPQQSSIRPDPTQFANLTFSHITHLTLRELHPNQSPFLAYAVRKMPLQSLVFATDSGATGLLMAVDPAAARADPNHDRQPANMTSAIQDFLIEMSTPVISYGGSSPPRMFRPELRKLVFQDYLKAADVDLELLAQLLIPCEELKTLKLIGFPDDAVAQVLETRESMMQ